MPMPVQKPGRSKQNYETPTDFLSAVKRRLRIPSFCHDFAADAFNTKAVTYFDKQRDALSVPNWADVCASGWGWLNPEFSDIDPWAAKCWETSQAGGHVALLVPAGVGANWYRDCVHRKACVLALNGRLCFVKDWATTVDPSPRNTTGAYYTSAPLYPKDCLLCLYGSSVSPTFDVWSWRV